MNFLKLNIEAYPDPVPPLVDVVTQNPGQSAEEIERYITIPIEIQMAGIPHVTAMRTISLFGLSDVKLQFTYDFTYDEAEQWVINRLSQLPPLPNGATPQISPESPIGEIYRYRVVGPPGFSVTDLKTIQDWILERRFKAVPGVIDVTGWGGKTKTYEITVDLDQSAGARDDPAADAAGAQQQQHQCRRADRQYRAAGRGRPRRRPDPLDGSDPQHDAHGHQRRAGPDRRRRHRHGRHQPRLGIAGQDDDDDIVQGIVLMRRGEQSMPTIRRVEAEVDKINSSNILPPGVRIERIYDRSDLINVTTNTVLHNMLFGIVLIFFVQWLFLGNLRSAIIVAATIPFALFFAIMIMVMRGDSANLLSVGAIDFGLIVDATVIMVENIFRHLASRRPRCGNARCRARAGRAVSPASSSTIYAAAREVNRRSSSRPRSSSPASSRCSRFSGVEGHIFGPMAKTYAYAIAGGLIATFTVSPALSSLLLPDRVRRWKPCSCAACGGSTARFSILLSPTARDAWRRRAAVRCWRRSRVRSLGLEFLPKLEEGNLWIRATMPTSISLEEANGYVNRMRRMIRSFPEVVTVVSQHGRPDDGTDATGFFNAEFFVPLKPRHLAERCRQGKADQDMSMTALEAIPGVEFNFSQYIEDNVEEAVSGVKGENSVKLFGNDLAALEKTADKIKDVMARSQASPILPSSPRSANPRCRSKSIAPRRRAMASRRATSIPRSQPRSAARRRAIFTKRAATAISDVRASRAAISREPRRHPQYHDRRAEPERKRRHSGSAHRSRRRSISSPAPPLSIASTRSATCRSSSAFAAATSAARCSRRSKDRRDVQLPAGYRLEWVGEFGNLQDALDRLEVVVPISIALICILLYFNFASVARHAAGRASFRWR